MYWEYLSMHPYQGIFRTEINPYGLYMRNYDPNTITWQSDATNGAPSDLFHCPVTWNLVRTRPNLCYVYLSVYAIGIYADVMIFASKPLIHQDPANCRVRHPHVSAVIRIGRFALVSIYDPIWLVVFELIKITVTNLIWLSFYWFDSTPSARIHFWFDSHNYIPIPVKLQGVPHRPQCPANISTMKPWNITELLKKIDFHKDTIIFSK